MRKILPFILLFCLITHRSWSQPDSPWWELEAGFHYGSVVPHHDFMKEFLEGPILAGEIKLGVQSRGDHAWEQLFNYPRYGFGYYLGTIGNPRVLGIPNGVFSYMEVAMLRRRRWQFNSQMALGLSFNHKQYQPDDNPLNLSIGSDLNVFFSYDLNLSFRLSTDYSLVNGVRFSHFSNGALKMPNTGFYMLDYFLGVRMNLKEASYEFTRKELPALDDRNQFFILLAGGSKQLEYAGDMYFMSTISLGYHRVLGRTGKFSLGADVFYDKSLEAQAKRDLPLNALIRQGFFAGYELMISKISLLIQQGRYTYRKVNYHQNDYSRLAFRYYYQPGVFANISLKSHWGKADFIEWGMGIIL